jgi:hypothetical protein
MNSVDLDPIREDARYDDAFSDYERQLKLEAARRQLGRREIRQQ